MGFLALTHSAIWWETPKSPVRRREENLTVRDVGGRRHWWTKWSRTWFLQMSYLANSRISCVPPPGPRLFSLLSPLTPTKQTLEGTLEPEGSAERQNWSLTELRENRPRFGCLVEKEEQERINNIGLQTSHWSSFGSLTYCGDIPNFQVYSKTLYKNWSLIFYRSRFCKGQSVPVFKQFTFCRLCTSGHNITEKKCPWFPFLVLLACTDSRPKLINKWE